MKRLAYLLLWAMGAISASTAFAEVKDPEDVKAFSDAAWAWRSQSSTSKYFQTCLVDSPCVRLHYRLYRSPKSKAKKAVVIMPGYGTPEIKYLYSLYLYRDSFIDTDVYVLDMRSQGRSDNVVQSKQLVVHVDSIDEYILDIKNFFAHEIPDYPDGLTVAAHSMSGHLISRAILDSQNIANQISHLVLLTPGYEINYRRYGIPAIFGGAVNVITNIVSIVVKMGGLSGHRLPPGMDPTYKITAPIESENVLEKNYNFAKAYYNFQLFEYAQSVPRGLIVERIAPSLSWLVEMSRSSQFLKNVKDLSHFKMEVDMYLAEKEQVVVNEAGEAFCAKLPHCTLHTVQGARHELLFEQVPISSLVMNSIFTPRKSAPKKM